MLSLIVTLAFGLLITYFALQNTDLVTLRFSKYVFPSIPIYVVIISSLLVGLLLSWIINFLNNIAAGFTLRGKENRIKGFKKDVTGLTKQNHQLELENTKLKAETNSPADDKSM